MLLSLLTHWVLRLAWADHLSYGVLAERERAVQLSPAMAPFFDRLADQREESGSETLIERQRAVALDPENAASRMRLGLRSELAGNLELAEQSLLAASDRSRLYQPRYFLAQYYFRRQNADSFWRWSRSALEIAYGNVMVLLDLDWRMRPDAEWIWSHAIPDRPEITRQYLVFLGGKAQWQTARKVADRIAATATMADRPILLDYCDRRLSEGDGSNALAIWNALCQRHLVSYAPLDPAGGAYLTDAGFDGSLTDTGFAWRRNNPSGIACELRNPEIRLSFSGSQQDRCTILWQYIPLEPSRHYRLTFGARTVDAGATDGLGWSVSSLSGSELGHQAAASGAMEFHSGQSSLAKLALVYRRPLGSVPLRGSFAIAELNMQRKP